jgi:hypothetical protein
VSRDWHRTIETSLTLQQAMFFKPVPTPSKSVVNPLLNRIVKHVTAQKHVSEDTQSWQGMFVAHTAQARLVVKRL